MNKEKIDSKEYRRLSNARPDLVAEWHPTKNIEYLPSLLTIGSGKKVWWQCEHGHEWEATVKNRAKGSKCPTCQKINQKTKKHTKRGLPENFLINRQPELLNWWHPTKNEGLNPQTITIKSNFKIWWQCEHGHIWQRRILEQIKSGCCPYCSGRLPIKGINDFSTTHPHLAKEWHPTKNKGLSPNHFTFGSAKNIWWQCEHGHEWEAKIFSRSNGMPCPFCYKDQTLKNVALGIKFPEIVNEWHPTKNGHLTPYNISYGSGKKVWWCCGYGHEWKAPVNSRTIGKTKCPHCRGINKKDPQILGEKHSHLIDEWHPTKNCPTLTPFNVTCGSRRKIWWRCKKGHEWESPISRRVRGQRCPICSPRTYIRSDEPRKLKNKKDLFC